MKREYVTSIPAGGLKTKWRVPIGGGYAGPAVASGSCLRYRLPATSGKIPATQVDAIRAMVPSVSCVWMPRPAKKYGSTSTSGPTTSRIATVRGPHQRSTVSWFSAWVQKVDLVCLGSSDGQVKWSKSLPTEYKAETPIWGHSAAPLVYGDLLITLAGGEGSVVVALDKRTCKEKWRALLPVRLDIALRRSSSGWQRPTADLARRCAQWFGTNYWQGNLDRPTQTQLCMSIAVPRMEGNKLFASGIGEVGRCLKSRLMVNRSKNCGAPNPSRLSIHQCSCTVRDNTLYGADCGSGQFIAASATMLLGFGKRSI